MKQKELYEVFNKQEKTAHSNLHVLYAFVSGGCMAMIAQAIFSLYYYVFLLAKNMAIPLTLVTIITITIFLTSLGVYDRFAQLFGAGMFIPISGFANALASCAIEARNEGLIYGIGSHIFALAGSVLTYGISASIIFNCVRYMFEVLL